MMELKVNKGHVQSSADGKIIDLIAELAEGVGSVLYRILEPAPDDKLKEATIKVFFEYVLEHMTEEEKNLLENLLSRTLAKAAAWMENH